MKTRALSIFLCALLCLLILLAPTVSAGARKGLLLWFDQVLPVLFPFTLLLQVMMSGDTLSWLGRLLAPLLRRCLHLSPAGGFCLLTGFLCGFPMGALTAAQSHGQKQLTRDEAQLLSACCNNAGPMFLSSYLLEQQLQAGPLRPSLTLIFYGCPLLWLWIRSRKLPKQTARRSTPAYASASVSFRQMMLNSSELMLKVGIFMMLFAILCELLTAIPQLPPAGAALAAALLEITNGAAAIGLLTIDQKIKTVLIMGSASFGGLCIACQTCVILRAQKLSFQKYLMDKAAISLMTGIVTLLWLVIRG